MNKNLKKVISAVSAIAISASTFATVSFAGSFKDVADTAANAEAIEVLSALGIINGYKDDATGEYNFLPDNPIKRQEAAKLFVAIQNMLDVAEGRKGTTKFADVDSTSEWATGYINLGVDKGYINGTSETTYNPKGDIKYQDVIKVLVSIMGYTEDVVKSYGGYPNGYLTIADAEGITKGVSFDPTAAATRGNVAMLIYNAMKLPIVQPKGMQYSSVLGAYVPDIEKQDGDESKYYKSLLTEYFDAYTVEGTVAETSKTNSTQYKANEIKFNVQKGEAYDVFFADVDSNGNVTFSNLDPANVGNTAAADYLNTYATAIVQVDEDDTATFLSFVPSGKNKTVSLDAGLFDDEETLISDVITSKTVASKPFLRYYASEDASRSTKYTLDSEFKIYVNGVNVDTTETNVKKYVFDNNVGAVELIDKYVKGSATDGKYDIINVEYYDTARVDSVTSKRITLKDSTFSRSTITLDQDENEDLVYHIYFDGDEIAITDLKKDDIISIAYDVKEGISNSNFYDIYVSRETQEGKYTTKDDDDETVRVDGEDYKFVGDYAVATGTSGMTLSNEYKLYLDYFNRIYTYDTVTSSVKLAIVDRVVTSSSYDSGFGAVLYFPDGTTKTVEVDSAKTSMTQEDLVDLIYKGNTINNSKKTEIEKRVFEYKLDSAGKKIIKLEKQTAAQSAEDAEYRARTNAIGAVKMNSATQIIDAQAYNGKTTPSYSDLKVGSLSTTFKDGIEYTVYNFGTKNNTDGTYPLVIVTKGEGKYTQDTHFAVVAGTPKKTAEGSKEGYTVEVLYNGEDKELFITDEATINDKIVDDDVTTEVVKGDIIVFDLDANGDITDLKTVYNTNGTLDLGSKYATTAKKFINTASAGFSFTMPSDRWLTGWAPVKSDVASIVAGVIVGKQSGYFTLGQIDSAKKTYLDIQAGATKKDTFDNVGGVADYTITDETKVSVFDYTKSRSSEQYYAGGNADIVATVIADAYTQDDASKGEFIEWTKEYDGAAAYELIEMNFAIAKVVDGVATDVFVIKGYLD